MHAVVKGKPQAAVIKTTVHSPTRILKNKIKWQLSARTEMSHHHFMSTMPHQCNSEPAMCRLLHEQIGVTVFVWKEKASSPSDDLVCQPRSARHDSKIGGLKMRGGGRERKERGRFRKSALQRHQAIWISAARSLELGLFTVKYNRRPALHRCWQQQVEAAAFSVANYHPRKAGIRRSDMTRWCHALICIWIKLLNRSRINRGRAERLALSRFSHWLALPHRDEL